MTATELFPTFIKLRKLLNWRLLAVCGVLILASGTTVGIWLLFGWTTSSPSDTGLVVRHHRFFGRVTKVTFDVGGDGTVDGKALFPWSDPWTSDTGEWCGGTNLVTMEDRNRDGQWDTWWRPGGEDDQGNCLWRFEADTNLDGKPDLVEYHRANDPPDYEDVVAVRGF